MRSAWRGSIKGGGTGEKIVFSRALVRGHGQRGAIRMFKDDVAPTLLSRSARAT